ncbi:hypothetical protein K2173_022986 [Erythroxylum novogranatense]|uniref:Uncharacterized protein n=1 Tax=Erythroxylum novogranatense TaxID=1862640 RepID=A0AAV8T840_9ROSI|nr:hypothetical protein K2173_022986 [Erythroxylum novogranatense]
MEQSLRRFGDKKWDKEAVRVLLKAFPDHKMERSTLLESYRHDRRKLIEFLLASGLIKELRTPSGPADSLANIDFDRLSADYILECVKSGKVGFISALFGS